MQTYSLYTNQYVIDSNNNFTLITTFRNVTIASKSYHAGAIDGVVVVLAVVGIGVFFVKNVLSVGLIELFVCFGL